jgi:hypothetical protein
MEPIEIARRQLGMATHLFIENLDPVSVHSLAGNAREILDRLAKRTGTHSFLDHVKSVFPDMPNSRYYAAANIYRNAFKHADRPEDSALAAVFDDVHNMHQLFVGWYTYYNLTGCTPIEAQVFESWYFAIEAERSADPDYVTVVVQYFGDMSLLTTAERKKRLKAAIERSRQIPEVMSDPRTESVPLVFVNS